MAEEDEIGGGIGTINDGSDFNANEAETGGGGSAGSNSTGNSTGGSDETPTEFDGLSNEQVVQKFVTDYLKLSAIGLTYKEFVPIYVDNKLGFAKLKEEYKKANPDMDPKEIDAAVDEERQAVIKEFDPEEGTTSSKEELKKKFDDLQAAMAEIRRNMGSIVKEFAKTTGEAFMPTTVGPVIPNPLSIALKLINGITKIKKILDRVTIALATFMALSKALGLDDTDPYNAVIDATARPLKIIMGLINKQESDPKFAEQKALDDYLQNAKENWPYGKTNNIDYQTVEGWGRAGLDFSSKTITINIWPIEEPKDRQKIVDQLNVYKQYNTTGMYDRIIAKWEAIIKYSDYLGFATAQFREIQRANAG